MNSRDLRNLCEAYTEIYEETVDEVSYEYDIFETISYALISSGLTANDVIDYFTATNEDIITEDYIELVEGTLIVESVVEDEYIEEELQKLNEVVGAAFTVGRAALQAARYAPQAASLGQRALSALGGAGRAATRIAGQGTRGRAIVRPALSRAGQAIRGAASRLRGGAQGASGGAGGGQGRAGRALGTAGKWALGGAGFEAGAAGVRALTGGRRGSGSRPSTSGGASTSATTPPKPSGGGSNRPSGGGTSATASTSSPSGGGSSVTRPATGGGSRPSGGGTSAARPTPSAPAGGAKVSPSAATPSGGQTGDKAKDMASWAKANPSLAAASAEKARIRGTSQTDNPLMKGFRSRMSMTPSVQSPDVSKLGKGNQSLTSNPNASLAATPKSTPKVKKEGVMWGDASKIVDDIADIYQSVYEAKKVDQDQDGDNDFADIRIARMIASGVPKEVAIAKVKGKPYNEEYELDEASPTNPRLYKGRHGQTEKEYQKGRSPAGKRISGDEKEGPASYASRWTSKAEPTRPGEKPKNTPRLSKSEKTYAKYEAGENRRMRPLKKVGGEKGLPEDFNLWIDELLDEGYDLSDYTWDEMYEIYEETDEEKRRNERRARIAELQAQGRVMTSSKRTSERARQRREEQRAEKLEKLANAAIEATRGTTRRSSAPMGSQEPEDKPEAPTANRRLSSTVKNDRLASRADELLRMLQKEDFVLWIDELLDEGYELDNWTDEELYNLYEEIIEEKYGTAAGRKRVAKMARAGKDIGKKGPGFEAMVTKLTPKYGKERATKIAAAQMWKTHA